MSKGIKMATIVLTALLGVCLIYSIRLNRIIGNKWKNAEENVKTYSELLSSSENKNRGYKLTIDQLSYFNDSIFKELNNVRKELGIKDKQLKSLQYIASSFTKTDTIKLPGDTIFRNPAVNIDTTITDKWYSLKVGLHYPSEITISPTIKSEKNIIVSSRRETVNPPKKFFLFRWFQKKQIVLQVNVIERNPYIKTDNNRYIEVLR